jgi:hypothetical protein
MRTNGELSYPGKGLLHEFEFIWLKVVRLESTKMGGEPLMVLNFSDSSPFFNRDFVMLRRK